MPYINAYDRALVDNAYPVTPGELNYALTRVIVKNIKDQGVSYDLINEIIADLELLMTAQSPKSVLGKDLETIINGYMDQTLFPNVESRSIQCIGALRACQMEFYRRVATSYEEKKIASNGDVYEVLDGDAR